jgi:hypothetical protein
VLMIGSLSATYSTLAFISRNRQQDVIGSTVLRFPATWRCSRQCASP